MPPLEKFIGVIAHGAQALKNYIVVASDVQQPQQRDEVSRLADEAGYAFEERKDRHEEV